MSSDSAENVKFDEIETPEDYNSSEPFIQKSTTINKNGSPMVYISESDVTPSETDKYMQIIDDELIPKMINEYKRINIKLIRELLDKHHLTGQNAKNFIKEYNNIIGQVQLDLYIGDDSFETSDNLVGGKRHNDNKHNFYTKSGIKSKKI